MTKANHTPTPWTKRVEKKTLLVCDENGNQIAAIRPVKRYGIAGDDAANQAAIVRAVNAHDDLMKATARLLRCYDQREVTTIHEAFDAAKQARAAIAKGSQE